MLNIKYQSYSLLYGHSLFWLWYSILGPLHLLPDLASCKCQYVVEQLPFSKLTVALVTIVRHNGFYRTILNLVFITSQLFYLFVYLLGIFSLTAESLADFGSQNSDSLTFKVLYNTPIMTNGGLLLITLANMLDSENHLWKIYDEFETLSVDYEFQAHEAKRCMLLTLPDVLVNMFENVVILRHIMASDFYRYHFVDSLAPHLQMTWRYATLTLVLLAGIMNCIMRYKPLLSVLYTSTCISKHLALINVQLSIKAAQPPTTAAMTSIKEGRQARDLDNHEATQRRFGDRLNRFEIYNNRAQVPAADANSSRLSLAGEKSREAAAANQTVTSHDGKPFSINNLYQLERHLTRVRHLIYDIDQVGPESVLAITAINFMPYFFLAFHLTFTKGWTVSIIMICLCFARSLPIIMALLAGSRVEKSCKKLVMILESRYLQTQTQSLIYKQMASSHLSLARTLKVLERIKLNCDGLMKIDSGTLKKCYLYIVTIILIVVQYDSLLYISL